MLLRSLPEHPHAPKIILLSQSENPIEPLYDIARPSVSALFLFLKQRCYHGLKIPRFANAMSNQTLRIATRQSPLALWQANFIKDQLLSFWPSLTIELCPFVTSGDKFLSSKLQDKGGKGLFVKELEEALLDHRADIAVHSIKDVPAQQPPGLVLPIIYKRDNPKDAFVSPHFQDIDALPHRATVGTSSLRRQAQLLKYRPDLNIQNLRGNIHTRLEKLTQDHYDAIILAAAGLERMRLEHHIQCQLSTELMLPACGQGALGIECRKDDTAILNLLAPLHHAKTADCVLAERTVNQQLGGHCHVPVAIFCQPDTNQLYHLKAKIFKADGSDVLEAEGKACSATLPKLAHEIASSLIQQGAHLWLEDIGNE